MIGAIFLALHPASGLEPGKAITQYIQSSWNNEDGLPQNSVHAIAQTADGFLWFGTEEGLARFDGVQFTVITRHDARGLGSDYVQTLLAAGDGSLWIGTDSGLSRLVSTHRPKGAGRAQDARLQLSLLTAKDGLASDSITALCEDHSGALWVGTTRGINIIRNGRIERMSIPGAPALLAVRAIVQDPDGAVWIGSDDGLFQWKQGRFIRWSRRNGLPGDSISALAVARDGGLLVSAETNGLAEIRAGQVQILLTHVPGNEIQTILSDRDGAIWITSARNGLARFYRNKLDVYDASRGLPSDRCTRGLFEDREGNLWVGLLDAGVVQLRDGKFTVFGKPEGLSGNYVGQVLGTRDGSVWVGADSNGLNQILPDGSVQAWNHRRGLPDEAIYSMVQTRDGSIWVGYRRGSLARIHNGRVTVLHDPQALDVSLNALLEDAQGRLWAGFYGKGLAQVEDGVFRHINLTGRVSSLAQSSDGAIWFGTDGEGIARFDGRTLTRFTAQQNLPSDHVMCIYADAAGDVWVGTASGGLSRIRAGHVVSWTVDQGLTETTVGSITGDNLGNLWLGGDNGIARFSKAELNNSAGNIAQRIHPVLFSTSDGLRSRETVYGSMPSTWKDRDGRLWFATIHGAAVIDPARMQTNPVVPPVWIQSVTFDSRNVPLTDGIRLGPGSGNFEVAYTAPSFVAPTHMQFRYRLEGFDRDWITAGPRRHAWYTNLPPGNYTFRVQAANSDGVWNLAGASISFVLRPPITRTPLAYSLYVLAILLIIWAVVVLRTRSLVRRQQELNRVVAERTAQLEEEKSSLEQARRELHTRATHDSLTGLFNRPAILDHLQREMSRATRSGRTLGVLIADLDHFKRVNDTYGHLAGDDVIREAAGRLRGAMRDYDLVGRYGGEEFLILFPGWDPNIAPGRIEELLDAIRSRPFDVSETEIQLTCSFGVATFRPGSSVPDVRELLRRADLALYVAKNAGRNQANIDTAQFV